MASMTNAEQQKKWREKKENELGREELRKKDRERQQLKRIQIDEDSKKIFKEKLAKLELNLNTLDVSHRNNWKFFEISIFS